MSNLPVTPLTPEQQKRLFGQVYTLLGEQVQSYHKHRRMGNNSSVSVELAQDLMESIDFTAQQAGGFGVYANAEEAIRAGQAVLEEKLSRAHSLLTLVEATAPHWQTECRWEAVRCLGHYLDSYDLRHLAHKGPESLFYPILIAPPEGIRGIDEALFCLHVLWAENRIMGAFPEVALDALWSRLPVDTLNQCERLLTNSIGKALIGVPFPPLTFPPEQYPLLLSRLLTVSEDALSHAAEVLCRLLPKEDEAACSYVRAILPQIRLWIGQNSLHCALENVFL